jgi:hypothetical protein
MTYAYSGIRCTYAKVAVLILRLTPTRNVFLIMHFVLSCLHKIPIPLYLQQKHPSI